MAMQDRRFVSDLLWVVNSPSLTHPFRRPKYRLSRAHVDAAQLTDFLTRHTTQRVGHYFEGLVGYYLIHHASVDNLQCGVQIRENGRTLGELDFIYRDADSQLVHLETAVKFYLYRRSGEWLDSHYVGPNAKDTLERKIRRLRDHQTPLSDHPLARQEMACQRDERIEKNEWICGRIFYHPDDGEPKHPSPLLSADHLRGVWIRNSEFEWFDRQPATTKFRVQRKPYWLSCRHDENGAATLLNASSIKEHLHRHFATTGNPVMVTVSANGHAYENDCLMIVPDAWPDSHHLSLATS